MLAGGVTRGLVCGVAFKSNAMRVTEMSVALGVTLRVALLMLTCGVARGVAGVGCDDACDIVRGVAGS